MSKREVASDEMLPQYDFSKGSRGKHAKQYQSGHTVKIQKTNGTVATQRYELEDGAVLLAPDVREYFSDSDSVNQALRSLIKLIPKKRKTAPGK